MIEGIVVSQIYMKVGEPVGNLDCLLATLPLVEPSESLTLCTIVESDFLVDKRSSRVGRGGYIGVAHTSSSSTRYSDRCLSSNTEAWDIHGQRT